MPMSILLYKMKVKYSKNDEINFMEELRIIKTVARVLECNLNLHKVQSIGNFKCRFINVLRKNCNVTIT